jgi:membrane protease YdiL (CAAX protease family)
MARRNAQPIPDPDERYGLLIHRPLNQLAVVLPLLIFFHAASIVAGIRTALLVPHYLQIVLQFLGATGAYLTAALVAGVLVGQHLARHDPWRISGSAVVGQIAEGIIWTLPLLLAAWLTTGLARGAAPADRFYAVLESVGAGVYEEFLFRLVLILAANIVLIDLLRLKKVAATAIAISISAVVFAACHFSPDALLGRAPMNWAALAFFLLAGGWWGLLLAWRGFAVAVISHVAWDLFVALM